MELVGVGAQEARLAQDVDGKLDDVDVMVVGCGYVGPRAHVPGRSASSARMRSRRQRYVERLNHSSDSSIAASSNAVATAANRKLISVSFFSSTSFVVSL